MHKNMSLVGLQTRSVSFGAVWTAEQSSALSHQTIYRYGHDADIKPQKDHEMQAFLASPAQFM